IANAAGAGDYAGESLHKADDFLVRPEEYLRRKQGRTPIGTVARGATQMAEDARVLTLQKKQQEKVAAAKQATLESQHKAEQEAIRQKEEMRARFLRQLNQVLETKDSSRGLIVSMPDVLFDSGQYTLKPAARERLARISGIVLAYPDLRLEIEGHTDSIGSDEFNQSLSEKRAASLRDYLVDAGVPITSVIARGLGKTRPIADNSSSE